MSSWLLEVSGNFLSIEAIICYLVFSDQQLAITLLDMISFILPRLSGELPYDGSGYQEHKGPHTLPSTTPHARRGLLKQFQQVEVSRRVEARTQPETWGLSSNWNTSTNTLRLATCLSLLLALVALGWSTAGSYKPSCYPDLLDADAEALVAGLERGAWTSVDLVKAYILRIEEVNPILRPVSEINPDAWSMAVALDAERSSGIIRSALHGIPILLKDNIATMDKLNTTAGSYALLRATTARDSTIASKLRAAGVIILGKTSMSEWANFRSSNNSNGWSAIGGQVLGAYYPNMDPSGSSSGSGVASSLGLALASIGTETDASILAPSSTNNLVGIKPSVGLTSRNLVIPISEHQDTVGPMARSVSDAAYLLSIIAGKDEKDNYTLSQPFDKPPDYTRSLNFSSLRGSRIGIPRNAIILDDSNAPILEAFEAAIEVIKGAGATVVDNTNYSAWDHADFNAPLGNLSNETIVLEADFLSGLPRYLSQLTSNPENIKNLADVSEFTHTSKLENYPERNTGLWDQALALDFDNTDFRFWQAYQHISFLGEEGGVTGALAAYDLDALILPTDYSSHVPAYAGLPVVTLPMGCYPRKSKVWAPPPWGLISIAPNIPFGLSFLGPKWSEEMLIGFAYAYEQRTSTRSKIKPYIVPSIQLGDVIKQAPAHKKCR